MRIYTSWLVVYLTDSGFFVRVFGFGFGGKDTRKRRLTFSERNGHKRHFMVGHWSFGLLAPDGKDGQP